MVFRKSFIKKTALPLLLCVFPFFLFGKDSTSYAVDDYTGWAYKKDSSFSVSEGKIKLSVKQGTGSFCIYALDEDGSEIPLLSTYDSFSSNHFAIKIGKKEYNLNRESGVSCQSRRTPYGAQLCYKIKKAGIIVVDFSFMPSDSSSQIADMLRVSAYLVNLSKKKQTFNFKGIFDTVLGEPSGKHFSTFTDQAILRERQFDSMDEAKWIRSANAKTAIQFLLSGKGISPTHEVTLSNRDSISKSSWVPSVKNERSFNSVLSYNNSAVCINWPEIQLEKNDSKVITFYISVGTDGASPAGDEFLTALKEGRTVLHECEPKDFSDILTDDEEKKVKKPRKDALGAKWWLGMPNIASDYEEDEIQSDDYEQGLSDESLKSSEKKSEKPIVITEEQLDEEYIRNLINYIKSLENGSGDIDQEELNRLNKELDAILEKVRSMN